MQRKEGSDLMPWRCSERGREHRSAARLTRPLQRQAPGDGPDIGRQAERQHHLWPEHALGGGAGRSEIRREQPGIFSLGPVSALELRDSAAGAGGGATPLLLLLLVVVLLLAAAVLHRWRWWR